MRLLLTGTLIVILASWGHAIAQEKRGIAASPSIQTRQGLNQPGERLATSPRNVPDFPGAQATVPGSPPRNPQAPQPNRSTPGILANPLNSQQNSQPANFLPGSNATQRKIDSKLREYKSADKEARKKEIEGEIKDLLSQQFDEKLKHPAQRIKDSRSRLDELQQQIKNRDQKADEIIDLRVTVLTNQAVGLGWGSDQGANGRSFFSNSQPGWRSTSPGIPAGLSAQYAQNQLGVRFGDRRTIQNSPNLNFGSAQYQNRTLPADRRPENRKDPEREVSVHELLNDFKKAKNDSERKPILNVLRERLVDEFQKHQKSLKARATQIEKSITDLEENIEKRNKAKSSIVDLKLRTVINQANGLGF